MRGLYCKTQELSFLRKCVAQARCKKSTGKRGSLFNDADMTPERGLLNLYLPPQDRRTFKTQARRADVQAIIDQLI